MKRIVFEPVNQGERGLWFFLRYNDELELTGFEEHDGYQGGPVTTPEGKAVIVHFAERALARGATAPEIAKFIVLNIPPVR